MIFSLVPEDILRNTPLSPGARCRMVRMGGYSWMVLVQATERQIELQTIGENITGTCRNV
jgi:hypothetical protein